jgi:hypothetical protein
MKKYYWDSSSGNISFFLYKEAIDKGYHQGPCDSDIDELLQVPYIKEQFDTINKDDLINELYEYGAWESDDLQSHQVNLSRLLWIACADIQDEILSANPPEKI